MSDEAMLSHPVSIAGMSYRLPGGIESDDALYACLSSATVHIGPVPADRFDSHTYCTPDGALQHARSVQVTTP